MTDPRTPAEIAEALEARAAKAQRDFDHSFAAFGEQPPLQQCAEAALLRAAAAKIRAMELALRPFAAFVDPLESLGGPSRLTDDDSIFYSISNRDGDHNLTLGRFRAARSALTRGED